MEQPESVPGQNEGTGFGIPELDTADQRLMALAQGLNQAIADGCDGGEIQQLMHQLVLEAVSHFEFEERILLDCAYPVAKGHAALHLQIKAELLHAMEQLADVEARSTWTDYGLLVMQLVFEHLHQETAKFREFLRSTSQSDSRGQL